ncbi:MAG: ABC transporter permease subunit [Pirellulales bacterium]
MLEGRVTLLMGDSLGRVRAWFPSNLDSGRVSLVKGHEFTGWRSPIVSIGTPSRNRTLTAIDEAGEFKILYATNDRELADVPRLPNERFLAAAFSPSQSELLTLSDQGVKTWRYDAPHADVSFKGLFRPVWYESDARPTYSWSANSTEPKFGLMPLIFGTLKATFYSMLFGAPLALMAAVFAAEFLHPNVKARIKPVIELMASLPSVVLGYVAGMVFAPLLSDVLPQAIAAIVFVPLGLLCGAYLWQLLPQRWTLQAGAWRLACIAVCILPGLALAAASGEWFEQLLFGKSMKGWLTEDILSADKKSSPFGGWFLLLLPLAGLLVVWLGGLLIDDILRSITRNATRRQAALWHFGKFVVMTIATLALAASVAGILSGFHADLRSPESDERYSRSNSLLVGITMGFAIIPLIFTIADDALSTVPNHLRSASLGAGATPWQTAVRIVIPTATSGLFSALMIGLGRAVGETMIVLMTVGNTPIMDFNIFNGFQTLSAAIAVGLTEAPHGGSQYRVLFLAAFALFVITFIINTVAESVRQRFRRRAYEL